MLLPINEGRKFLSIEFHAVQETRSKSGVREIQQAFLAGRAALVERSRIQTGKVQKSGPTAKTANMAMKFWPWSRPEVRSANYTDQIIAQIISHASGASDGSALAAIETAARMVGKRFSECNVSHRIEPCAQVCLAVRT